MSSTTPFRVEVVTPARLHLGFLDLQGGLGRRFGSLGLTIDTFATSLCAERAEAFAAQGPGAERALRDATACYRRQVSSEEPGCDWHGIRPPQPSLARRIL